MKWYTKTAIAVGAVLALLLVAMTLLPFLFRDRIARTVEAGIDEAVAAEVEWESVGLSLIRTFPNPSLRLDGLTVTGIDEFSGHRLASVDGVRVAVNLPSLWRNWRHGEPIVVRSVDVDRPIAQLLRLEDGTANWDIVRERPEPEPGEPRAVAVSLQRLSIRDGSLTLEDRQAGLTASVEGFDQTLQGDFTQDFFVLRTRAGADDVSVAMGGVTYLTRAELDLTADVEADMVEHRFTFRENELRLNALALSFTGWAQVEGEDVELDVAFEAPATDFRHLLSLVPAIYASEFDGLETEGTMALSGRIGGRYGEGDFPAFAADARVENGMFRYPDLPLPAREIEMEASVENPGGDLDNTVVEVSRFHVVIGNDPIEGALVLRTPVSDPDVDFRVAGRLDLGELQRTVKLEGLEELEGVVTADAALRTRLSWLDAGEYERVTATGGAEARNVAVRAAELPHPVFVDEAVLRLAPEHVELSSLEARIGSSDVRASGTLDNVLAYALRGEELRGRASVESRRFDLNEWRSEEEEVEVVPVPPNVDFRIDAVVDELRYGNLEMTDARGGLRVAEERAVLEDFHVRMLGGEVTVAGFYETVEIARPTFEVELEMRELEIPAAFRELLTVQAFAPVAAYATGTVNTGLRLGGVLGSDMIPLFQTLTGNGSLETSRFVIEDFPGLDRIAEAVRIPQLSDPALNPIRASFAIRDGRLHVEPFDVEVGDLRMGVSGSNGVDQTLDYQIRLEVPRAVLGSEAERAVEGLLARADRAGVELEAADVIELGIELTGTVTDPSVRADVGRLWTSAREEVEGAVRDEAERRVEEATEAARAEAERIVREAEERAENVRQEARELAETIRGQGDAAADSVLTRATNPVARAAARPVADRLRREADERAERVVEEADEQADRIVEEARRRAEEILAGRPPGGG